MLLVALRTGRQARQGNAGSSQERILGLLRRTVLCEPKKPALMIALGAALVVFCGSPLGSVCLGGLDYTNGYLLVSEEESIPYICHIVELHT